MSILNENMSNTVVNTVPADGLAPSGARASADIVETNFGSRTYTGQALDELINLCMDALCALRLCDITCFQHLGMQIQDSYS